MITCPNLNEPEMLKVKTKEDGLINLRYRIEKHDYENNYWSLLKLMMSTIRRIIKV